MGWSSGGEIFDDVAQELIDGNVPEPVLRRVLSRLLGQLQAGDWDTEDESLARFRHHPVVVGVFYENGVGNRLESASENWVEGRLAPEWDGWWRLRCSACTRWSVVASLTARGHDALLGRWADHDRDKHGGTGEVDESKLIGRS